MGRTWSVTTIEQGNTVGRFSVDDKDRVKCLFLGLQTSVNLVEEVEGDGHLG